MLGKGIYILLIAILLVLVSILLMLKNREMFVLPVANNEIIPQTNLSNAVWDRHPIQDSIPQEYDVKSPNVYYNELNNEKFMDALNQTFSVQNMLLMPDGAEWSVENLVDRFHIPPAPMAEVYNTIIPWLLDVIQKSPYFKLPGDEPAPFQIIHDHWNSWASSAKVQGRVRYDVEIILYREAKYHGKHVGLKIVVDDRKIVGVMDLHIIGIVYEDHFGLFPVLHTDDTDLKNLNMPFNDNPLADYPPIIDNSIIQAEVAKREKEKAIMEKIEKLYKLEPPPL